MSAYLSEEDLDRLKARDARFATLERSIAVEHELKNSKALNAILQAVRDDADRAMDALAEISPMDHQAVAQHLVRVSTLVYIRRVLTAIMRQGEAAEAAIRAEDAVAVVHERDD